jgi:hypothetical protein
MLFLVVGFIKLFICFEIQMDELMVDSFTSMIHEIRNWDHAGCTEVVAETSGEDCGVTGTE